MKKPPRTLTPEEKRLWRYVTRNDDLFHPPAEEEEEEIAASQPEPSRITLERIELPRVSKPYAKDVQQGDYAGIDRNTAERFRKGNYAIDATLDLHGMTREKAYGALIRFIHAHAARGHRCLLVITGKGRADTPGVLKTALPQWLASAELSSHILTFDAAQPKHGGSGAYYLLLRRARQDRVEP